MVDRDNFEPGYDEIARHQETAALSIGGSATAWAGGSIQAQGEYVVAAHYSQAIVDGVEMPMVNGVPTRVTELNVTHSTLT
jgi:hypothetical protein